MVEVPAFMFCVKALEEMNSTTLMKREKTVAR